jgi:hypothetical protein
VKGKTMFLPKGTDVWKNLKSFFVDVDKLLLFLKKNEFTGCVHFAFPDQEGVILLQEGDAVGGMQERNEARKSGPSAPKEILMLARNEANTSITISKLPSETVDIVSEAFRLPTRAIYRNLSSEFSNLAGFVAKAKKEGFTGYIEIHFPKENNEGIILIEKGRIKATITDKMQIGLKNEIEADWEALNTKIVEEAQKAGVHFDVYASI